MKRRPEPGAAPKQPSSVRLAAAALAERPLHLPSFEERLEKLLSVPVLQMKIPADLREPFEQARRGGERTMMVQIFLMTAGLNAANALFDLSSYPSAMLPWDLPFRAVISLALVVGAGLLMVRGLFEWRYVMLLFCGAILVGLAAAAGVLSHNPALAERTMFESIMAVTVMTMFIRIDAAMCCFVCCVWLAILAAGVWLSAIQPVAAKCQVITFCGMILAMLTISRYLQNLYMFRMFITHTRAKIRDGADDMLNQKIKHIAYADRLTDVPNRRYFDELCETICQTIADAGQSLLPLSLCMIDLDHFADLNESLGHERGDAALRAVAGALKGHMRGRSDILARYGGDEFLLLLPGTNPANARRVAERMHGAISALGLPNPGAPSGFLSASIGVFTVESAQDTLQPLMRETEKALAAAKRAGRNRVNAEV